MLRLTKRMRRSLCASARLGTSQPFVDVNLGLNAAIGQLWNVASVSCGVFINNLLQPHGTPC